MRGGYRWNAGRPATKSKLDNLRRIDIRRWVREGFIRPNNYFGWEWTTDGEQVASISVKVFDNTHLQLIYRIKSYGQDQWESVEQDVALTTTDCNYGNSRYWFICPRTAKRSAMLYLTGNRWYSRYAFKSGYNSQSEDSTARMHRKQASVTRLLDEDLGRPKGMHMTTYNALIDKYDKADEQLQYDLAMFLCSRMARIDNFK